MLFKAAAVIFQFTVNGSRSKQNNLNIRPKMQLSQVFNAIYFKFFQTHIQR